MVRTIAFDGQAVMILNQNKLPQEINYEPCYTAAEVAQAIKELKIRGAPLIGVAAAFGLALAVHNYQGSLPELDQHIGQTKKMLAATRPTAINLFVGLERIAQLYELKRHLPLEELGCLLMQEAQTMYEEDIAKNEAIGQFGQTLLGSGSKVLTLCNAGALATCGYGTALGIIRSAFKANKIDMVWACETRPILQGARLTIWELMQDNIPVTLITDSMAAYVMQLKQIDAVVVGADRIAGNGDTANKIGTYSLAILAAYHNIPFYVAAPRDNIDLELLTGEGIPIEERDGEEIRQWQGHYFTVSEVEVFNPAFDITPHQLITAIITEKGIIRPPYSLSPPA